MLECHQWLDDALAEVSAETHVLELTFELRTRSRLLTQSADGVELGLFLPRGRVLQHGDRLLANDGSTVLIQAAPEPLTRVGRKEPHRCPAFPRSGRPFPLGRRAG